MELFHVLNRGVDRRPIVLSDRDRRRFVRNLYEMNDARPVTNLWYRASNPFSDLRSHYDDRERLVTIHGWCLMGNHYHLLLSEVEEGGLTTFLRKLNIGYAKYFNEQHERSGTLFQGRTKKILIESDAHFMWILQYIHFNPLDFLKGAAQWRVQCPNDTARALEWLRTYRWSSYQDYIGDGNTEAILAGSFMFKEREASVRESRRYLKSISSDPTTAARLE